MGSRSAKKLVKEIWRRTEPSQWAYNEADQCISSPNIELGGKRVSVRIEAASFIHVAINNELHTYIGGIWWLFRKLRKAILSSPIDTLLEAAKEPSSPASGQISLVREVKNE